jgi:tRNA pseudouridine65 synthase
MRPGSGVEIELLHLDAHLVAVHKPSGLCVHPTRGHDRRALLHHVRDRIGRHVFPVHRLDRSTSGIVVFALDSASARSLADAFAQRRVDKRYRAIVRGYAPQSATIDSPLAVHDGGAPLPAVTELQRLATLELPHPVGRYPTARYSLVELHPITGRTHQLRRHLAHVRHPIVGDVRHGDGKQNRFAREHFGLHRLLLWATELALPHPEDGATLHLRAAAAPELHAILSALEGSAPAWTPPPQSFTPPT